MFPYVIVSRELTKEETEARARRWKVFFWLIMILWFWRVLDAIFYSYQAVAFPHIFKFLVYAIVPATLSWLMVRYWRVLLGSLLFLYLGAGLIKMVVELWRSTAV